MTARLRWPLGPEAGFLVLASLLCTASLSVLAHPGYWERPATVAPAVAADLVLGLPLLAWLLLVRTGRADRWTLLPLVAAGLLLARWWIPPAHLDVGFALEAAVLAVEAGLVALLAVRARKVRDAYRRARPALPYAADALRSALREVLGRRAGGILSGELSSVWYAVTGWRRPPDPPASAVAFSSHRRNAWPAVLAALCLAVAAETVALHLLVGLWSPVAAWILSGLSVYSVAWLLGDLHAARLNPTLLTGDALHLRLGLRWHADVPWAAVRAIHREEPPEARVRMTFLGAPDLWIETREPVTVHGVMGIERRVRFVGVGVDDPGRLAEEIRGALERRG